MDRGGTFGRILGALGIGNAPGAMPKQSRAAEDLIDAFVEQLPDRDPDQKPNDMEAGRQILALPAEEQIECLMVAVDRITSHRGIAQAGSYLSRSALKTLVSALLRRPLPFQSAQLTALINAAARSVRTAVWSLMPIAGLLAAISRHLESHGADEPLRDALRNLRSRLLATDSTRKTLHIAKEIAELLDETCPEETVELEAGEAWTDQAITDLAKMSDTARSRWMALLAMAGSADGAKPSKKWLKDAREQIDTLGVDAFVARIIDWFALVQRGRNDPRPAPATRLDVDQNLLISPGSADILKGLTWCCAAADRPELAQPLADIAQYSLKKVPNHGPRCVKLGNAAIVALSSMTGREAAAQLTRLNDQVKQRSGKKKLGKALSVVAERSGQTVEDLAEMSMPTYGLGADGSLRQKLGEFEAELKVAGSTDAQLTWHRADGKPQKSVPADVKRDHPQELKKLQRAAKDIEKMLSAQRSRLERLLSSGREWTVSDWRERYLDHPLLSQLSRRLIWTIRQGERATNVAWLDGRIVDSSDRTISLGDDARLRLWHPMGAAVTEVQAWRQWLGRHEIVQPFKQAHREIYILTDAELATRVYSNRFAAHIVRQHQFVALAQQRGWKAGLQGGWDGGDQTPTIELPQWRIRAEFWVNVAAEGPASATGVAIHLSTDQVRFCRDGEFEPLDLTEVPAIAFSEIMRDVDLFVGIASVGNDPTWHDTGEAGFGTYWQHFNFGDLSATATTRRDVLAELLPRLKIAERCSLAGKFLAVRGDIRTYKIHLGSGNILMEPNDQYLCIVPDRQPQGDGKLFLPFEGDATLSVILSKAFLLADDRNIKDATIVRQIGRG